MLLGLLVGYPALAGDRLAWVVAAVGMFGWLVFALGLLGRWPLLLVWGIAAFGAEYALFLRLRGGSVDARAPLVAAALLVAAELAFESLGGGLAGAERSLVLRVALAVVVASAVTAVAGGILLVASTAANAGLVLEAAGVAAAVLCVAFLTRLAARARTSG